VGNLKQGFFRMKNERWILEEFKRENCSMVNGHESVLKQRGIGLILLKQENR